MKFLRRVVIALVGGTVVLIGIVMIVLPAPGALVILVGLGILALEFAWATHWLKKVRALISPQKNKAPDEAEPAAVNRVDQPPGTQG